MRALLLLGCAACAGTGGGRLAARLQRPHNPEQRFDVAARAQQCRGGHGVLLEAASEDGNGLLLWLRGDSLAAGEYPLRTASDTSPGRAATASLRYMTGDIAHGLTLDSGVVRLTAARSRLAGDVVAAGTDLGGMVHVNLAAHFADVAVADSTSCAPA
ncbi:MAG TPA: hypothetical protein VNH63_13280 [Gemmatimonadales bacterium]|nr:hypothetical protein [Gemmatimonadales bacterium]